MYYTILIKSFDKNRRSELMSFFRENFYKGERGFKRYNNIIDLLDNYNTFKLPEDFNKESAKRVCEGLEKLGARVKICGLAEEKPDVSSGNTYNLINKKDNNITDSTSIQQYLEDIYNLEKDIYCSERGKKQVNHIMNDLGTLSSEKQIKAKLAEEPGTLKYCNEYQPPDSPGIGRALSALIISIVCAAVSIILLAYPISYIVDINQDIILTVVPIAVFIITMLLLIKRIRKDKKVNENWWNKYYYLKEEDRAKMQKELMLMPKYEQNEVLLDNNIASSKEVLSNLYRLDIIFPKYRNIMAVSQIYEYFQTGRCTELGGPHGAYNLYEQELRMNIIINKLDIIISQLDRIQQTQFMMYTAINDSNNILAQINDNMAIASYNSSVIARNTQVMSKYYSSY